MLRHRRRSQGVWGFRSKIRQEADDPVTQRVTPTPTPTDRVRDAVSDRSIDRLYRGTDPLVLVVVFIYLFVRDIWGFEVSQSTLLWGAAALSVVRVFLEHAMADRKARANHEEAMRREEIEYRRRNEQKKEEHQRRLDLLRIQERIETICQSVAPSQITADSGRFEHDGCDLDGLSSTDGPQKDIDGPEFKSQD